MPDKWKKLSLNDIFVDKKFESETLVPFPTELSPLIKEKIEKYLQNSVDIASCFWNKEATYLLFQSNTENIYRRSIKSLVHLLDIQTNEIIQLHQDKIMHVSFSPDGKKIAYVCNNNLFVYSLDEKTTIQVTQDGKWNHIIYGNCDWVYEEEFAFSKAYQWSPDSTLIAFYRFDESAVKEYSFPLYDDQYNQNYTYKYPKAGQTNASVEIWAFHTENGQYTKFPTTSADGYIPKILWAPDNQLCIFHLNRRQNELNIWINNLVTKETKLFYSERNERYIDFNDDWLFLNDGQLVYTSEISGFRNIYLRKNEADTVPLTRNQYELNQIIAIDKKNNLIYYVAAFPNPMEQHLFVIDLVGNQKQLSETSGWNDVFINLDLGKMIIENSNIRQPTNWIQYEIIQKENGQLPSIQYEKTLLSNETLKQNISDYQQGQIVFLQIPISKKENLNGWMLLPTHFEEKQQYPVLFCNYGGPGSQSVTNKFGSISMWHHYLSQEGYIVVSVDNTGTGGRGEDFKKRTYLQLGRLEMDDQIKAAKFMSNLPYVDANRIGHWGWSFGGFMSCLAITRGASIFKYAVAVAPVTSWKYYDTIYTERYMRTPEENQQGYEQHTPFSYIDEIKGKLLIIHGSADDNVHLQNTMQLSKQLIEKNISFEIMVYPDKNHRINGGNTPIHLWQKITNWLFQNS